MQANRSDTQRVLPPTILISLSRRVAAFAAIMQVLMTTASAQVDFPVRNWEIGTDIYYETSTKALGYTSDPKVLIVELPAGQSEIEQRFRLTGPPKEVQDQLREELRRRSFINLTLRLTSGFWMYPNFLCF